jgi:hypothetical protein
MGKSAYSYTTERGADEFLNCVVYIKVQHSQTLTIYHGGGGGGGGGPADLRTHVSRDKSRSSCPLQTKFLNYNRQI